MIVDGVPTNRILMKVRLTGACYDVTAFASGNEAIHSLRHSLPDIIVIGATLPDMTGTDLCRLIRSLPGCRTLPIMMQVQDAQRLAALSAGATAIIDTTGDELTLFARIRGALRSRDNAAEDPDHGMLPALAAPGVDEAAASFDHHATPRIIFVTNRNANALGWRQALQHEMGLQIPILDHDCALAQAHEANAADIYLIAAEIHQPGDGLRLLSELRSRGHSRHAGFLVVTSPQRTDLTPMALDLGAGDVLPDVFPTQSAVAEAALRIRTQMENKRTRDSQRRAAQRNLIWAMKDPLTGLYNRRFALPRLDEMILSAAANSHPLIVIALDIDHFKRVNDLHGHPVGDAILAGVAARLAENLPGKALLARIGGEEFLLALQLSKQEDASAVAERVRAVISDRPFSLPDQPQARGLQVTVSLGVAILAPDADSATPPLAQQLIAHADRALLQAKAQGRNRVIMADHDAMA